MTAPAVLAQPVRPLLARVQPIAGESLMSLVVRSGDTNVIPRLSDLLGHAGITSMPAFAPFTLTPEQACSLAALLGVEEAEVTSRLHLAVEGPAKGLVTWAGVRMERRFIEARRRRVSPQALEASAHHRLAWTCRALCFCPETFELLVSSCWRCGVTLGWTHTRGATCCERCRASLLETRPRFAPVALQASLQAAADLISAEAEVRKRVLDRLPSPFASWDAGEVFTAVVELGVAWEHPESRRGSQIARDLGAGRLDWLGCEAIARGYELVQGWPDGFPTLVARLRQGQSEVRLSPSMALRELGTLGRFFDSRQPDTPLRRLLCSCIGDAAVAAATPVKLGALAHLGGLQQADTLSLTQAQSSFAIAKAALSRLVPQSEALVSGRTGRGGSVRFDRARLQVAVADYKRAMRQASAAALLNVPAFCLPALAEHGLIEAITDPDARRLADVDALYGAASVQACVQALREVVPNRDGGRWPEPLAHAMARRFSAQAWAKVFKGLLSGRLPLCAMDATRHRLIDQLLVDVDFVRAFLAGSKDFAQHAGVKLTACDAGLLLGAHETYIPKLIEGGLLRGSREGRVWIIDLADLVAFDDDYVLSVELYRTHFYVRGFDYSCAPPSLLDMNKFRVWERDDPALRVRPSYEQHLTGGRRAKRRRMQPLPR